MATATARFSATTGDPVTSTRALNRATIRGQSVASAVVARAWQAAMAAWRA